MSYERSEFSARHWYRLSWLSFLLAPLSLVFLTFLTIRRFAYVLGVFSSDRLPVRVLVVGNVVVGGTGKTPLVLHLVEALKRLGWRPGIVSRGYKGRHKAPAQVHPGDAPEDVGDEPLLLARRSGVPVFVGKRRADVARALLAAHPQCDLIISDDGLQHYALARDCEIAVEDSRGFGNGLLLPAGPLREPPSRHVDAIVLNGEPAREGVWQMLLLPRDIYALRAPETPIPADFFAGKRVHAIAGIGHPQRFFDTLSETGLSFVPHAFPDHHRYVPADLLFSDCDAVLMTEKDAVKCASFDDGRFYALRVDARLDEAFAHLIDARLHGSKTA
jgi:tetraacyldisaccharide 4'-kinase